MKRLTSMLVLVLSLCVCLTCQASDDMLPPPLGSLSQIGGKMAVFCNKWDYMLNRYYFAYADREDLSWDVSNMHVVSQKQFSGDANIKLYEIDIDGIGFIIDEDENVYQILTEKYGDIRSQMQETVRMCAIVCGLGYDYPESDMDFFELFAEVQKMIGDAFDFEKFINGKEISFSVKPYRRSYNFMYFESEKHLFMSTAPDIVDLLIPNDNSLGRYLANGDK